MEKNNTLPLPTLPMQLMLCLGTWAASPFALQCAKSAWPLWKQQTSLPQNGALAAAVAREANARANNLLTGILRYLDAPYARTLEEKPTVWRQGNARLLDYGGDGSMVLFVPSLINRYYILDLEEERSLLRHLAAQGLHPVVLDWDAPGEFENNFGCNDYITEILLPAIEFLSHSSGKPVSLVGYCMGGVLAQAAAQLKPKRVGALALLATPWDFHCESFAPFVIKPEHHAIITKAIASQETLPADVIQSLFYMTDPWVFAQKFRRFARLAPDSPAAQEFIALEYWVNDGVPMTAKLAQDCMVDWAQKNQLAVGGWQIAGKKIDPKKIKQPAFIAMPKNDHVVPYDCAAPLAKAMPQAKVIHPGAGHVGMVVGQQAKKELWQPLLQWLRTHPERPRT